MKVTDLKKTSSTWTYLSVSKRAPREQSIRIRDLIAFLVSSSSRRCFQVAVESLREKGRQVWGGEWKAKEGKEGELRPSSTQPVNHRKVSRAYLHDVPTSIT